MCYEIFGFVENRMKTTAVCLGIVAAGFLSTAAFAQTVQQDQQRDVNQQQRRGMSRTSMDLPTEQREAVRFDQGDRAWMKTR